MRMFVCQPPIKPNRRRRRDSGVRKGKHVKTKGMKANRMK